jgi:hypothetical protein
MQDDSQSTGMPTDRRTLVRDIATLQVKLVLDGLRDFILVPVSLVAGIMSLVKSGDEPATEFYDLLKMGRRSERWINLFGAAERVYGPANDDDQLPPEDIDALVSRVESFVVDEYQKGGVTKQAKDQVNRALNKLHKRARRGKNNSV